MQRNSEHWLQSAHSTHLPLLGLSAPAPHVPPPRHAALPEPILCAFPTAALPAPLQHGSVPQGPPFRRRPTLLPTCGSSPAFRPTAGPSPRAAATARGAAAFRPHPPLPAGTSAAARGDRLGTAPAGCGARPAPQCASPGPQGAASPRPRSLLPSPRCLRGRVSHLSSLPQLLLHSSYSVPSACSLGAHPAPLGAQLRPRRGRDGAAGAALI